MPTACNVRIDNGRTKKAELPPFEILAKRVRLPDGRSLAAPFRILPMLRAGWSESKRAGALPLNFHPSCSGPSAFGSWHSKNSISTWASSRTTWSEVRPHLTQNHSSSSGFQRISGCFTGMIYIIEDTKWSVSP